MPAVKLDQARLDDLQPEAGEPVVLSPAANTRSCIEGSMHCYPDGEPLDGNAWVTSDMLAGCRVSRRHVGVAELVYALA